MRIITIQNFTPEYGSSLATVPWAVMAQDNPLFTDQYNLIHRNYFNIFKFLFC